VGSQISNNDAALLTWSVAGAQNHVGLLDPKLPAYIAHEIPAPHDRGYLTPDGSARIVGFDDMAGMVGKWDAMFSKAHPDVRFAPILKVKHRCNNHQRRSSKFESLGEMGKRFT
jgi:hypothetical protein